MNKDKDKKTTNEEFKDADQDGEYSKLIEHFKKVLGNLVKNVKVSKKLTSSIACLTVSNSGMDMHMERLLMEQKRLASSSAKILELNPKHPIIQGFNSNILSENSNHLIGNEQLARLIFDQACIIEGQPLDNAGEFVQRINSILEKALLSTGIENNATIEKTKGSKPRTSTKKKEIKAK